LLGSAVFLSLWDDNDDAVIFVDGISAHRDNGAFVVGLRALRRAEFRQEHVPAFDHRSATPSLSMASRLILKKVLKRSN